MTNPVSREGLSATELLAFLGNSSTVELRTLTAKVIARFQELSSRPKRLTGHPESANYRADCLTIGRPLTPSA